ncbi:MAG: beta-galactosidase, partial [Anaerolineae bacterium]|nr:beta-galactosidase [Anaerolineae bacterium]
MIKRLLSWPVFLAVFIAALTATGYFALQLRQNTPPPLAGPLAAEKGYGVTIDLTAYEATALAETLADVRERRLHWLRQPVNWAQIEPAPGEFEWQALDRIVAAIDQANATAAGSSSELKLILVLQTSPAWARPPNTLPMTPPTELSDFGRFTRALAERYGPQVDYYQIWHEPNLSANWGDAFVNPAAYADLLREAALNLRTADPTMHILTAALAPTLEEGPLNLNEMAYLDRLYQAQAAPWFDIVAGQPYGFDFEPGDPARPDQLTFRRLELLRQVMLTHGDAATPIWATAFGWNALPADWTGQPSPWKNAP